MHYKRTAGLVTASPGWVDNSPDFEGESWSLIIGNRVFSSPEEPRSPDPPEVDVKGAHLHAVTYDLPLVEGRSWCPFDPPPSYNSQCLSMGRLTVAKRESYTTPVAIFEECYEITEEYNSGGVTEWFCNGLGVVARKYDHSGTRFGFEDTLISYSRGPMEK